MRLSSIVAPLAGLGALVTAALTTVEYDLVFPRDNVAYEPMEYLPVLFAVKNSKVPLVLSIYIGSQYPDGRNYTIMPLGGSIWGDAAANETTFYYASVDAAKYNFTQEGTRPLNFWLHWGSCGDGPNGHGPGDSDTTHNQSSTASITLRTQKGGQAVNFLAAEDAKCPGLPGISVTLDDTVKPVVDPSTASSGIHHCVTVNNVASPGSDLVTDACTAKIPPALVEEISWRLSKAGCTNLNDCPELATHVWPPATTATASATHTSGTTQPAGATTAAGSDPAKNAAERLVMVGTVGLAVGFGVFGALLA